MHAVPRANGRPPIPDGLYRDATLLVSTAKHLRWLAWYRLITHLGLALLIVLSHLNRLPPIQLFVIAAIYAGFGIGSAGFAFLLAHFVRRAELWAVILALFVSVISVGITLLMLIGTPPFQIVMIVFETAFLIFSLTLVKQLYQSIGAAQRIQTAMMPPAEALPADEPMAWRHEGRDVRSESSATRYG